MFEARTENQPNDSSKRARVTHDTDGPVEDDARAEHVAVGYFDSRFVPDADSEGLLFLAHVIELHGLKRC